MYCVYIHKRKSDLSPFYVGKGKPQRPYSKAGRNQRWQRTVSKHGIVCQIVKSDMPEPCAFSLEKALIHALGKQRLCNMTDGGEGTSGRVPSCHQRQKCSLSNKGTKPSPQAMDLARKKNSKPIATRCGLQFSSVTDAAKFVNPTNWKSAKVSISFCANGNTNHSYGYEWGFVENGETNFRYVSKMSQPRPKRWRPIRCSNGLSFDAVGHAVDWLRQNGNPKANTGAVCRSAKRGENAYGMRWSYV